MPEWIAETLKYVGPFGVFCIAMLYLLLRDAKNRRPAGGNPGTTLTAWQQDMKQGQEKTNEKLDRIERSFLVLLGRLGVDPPP